jgi:hypothetical protein
MAARPFDEASLNEGQVSGSGGVLWSHSRGVVCFSDTRELLKNVLPAQVSPGIPDTCRKGLRSRQRARRLMTGRIAGAADCVVASEPAAFRARQKAAA